MLTTRLAASLAATLLVLTLAGCGDDTEPVAQATTPPATAAPSAPPSASPTTPAPTATTDAAHRLGETVTVADGAVRATVLAFRQPVAKSAPSPEGGGHWAAVEVKVCAAVDGVKVSRTPWVLTYGDGAVVESSHVGYGAFPRPEYPWDSQSVRSGRCVRGWIVYPSHTDERPEYVQYQPEGIEPVEWRIG